MSVSVWVKPLLGQWTPIGEADYPRVLPSSVHLEADEWGPLQATLTLDLGPRLSVPAFLVQYASAYVEIDGARVWSGFIQKLDRADRLLTVNLQGSQMRLDDQTVRWAPVDDRLTSWSGDIAQAQVWTAGQAQVAANAITLTYPNGQEDWGKCNAVTYVPGEGRVRALLVAFTTNISVSGLRFGIWAFDGPTNPVGINNPITPLLGWNWVDATARTILVGPFDPQRYVSVGLYTPGSTTVTGLAGFTCTITAILAAERSVFIANNQSTVTGDAIAARVQAMVTGLNPDTQGIRPTPTIIPSFAYDTHTPARTLLDDAAQYDDAIHKIDANDRLVFGPRPTGATVELGAGAPATSETPADPSTMVSAVQIDSQDASGNPVTRTVTLLDLPEMPRRAWPATITNPDFASSDLSAWTQELAGTATTDPTRPDTLTLPITPPVGYSGTMNWQADYITLNLGGSLPAGVPVTISWWALHKLGGNQNSAYGAYILVRARDADWPAFGPPVYAIHYLNTVGGYPSSPSPPWPWQQYAISFVPRETWTSPTIMFSTTGGGYIYIAGSPWLPAVGFVFMTGFRIYSPGGQWANLNRTGSLSVSSASTDSQLLSLGQTYLRVNNRLGYTGERDVPDGGARDAASHAPLPAASLLAMTGTYARLADRIDPADGKVGAMAYISQVAYEHSSRRSAVTVGQRYAAVDELIARYANPLPRFPVHRKRR